MSLQDWGSLGELIGAVATVFTLAYLAIQIRQNSRQMREATRIANAHAMDSTVESFARYRALLVNADNAELYLKGLESYTSLNKVDQIRFRSIIEEYFFAYAAMYERLKADTYEWGIWEVQIEGAAKALEMPGASQWWCERKHLYGIDFSSKVDKILEINDTT